ncbi:YheT family hydrolase [Nannocystis pusilla]|uniref:YheT family hydrolase n=1 Tax=Nannocystis pusilla TaxID=889268 RepID=UPI003DA5983C
MLCGGSRCSDIFWTIGPNLRHRLLPHAAPAATAWSTTLHDRRVGPVRLTGALARLPGARELVVLVHGLGGAIDSSYVIKAARAAAAAGLDSLRLSLRGADRSGEDFYHAGLVDDVTAALQSPALADYARVYVIGFSLGGHMTLRWAMAPSDPRVRAVASVCAPLDLAAGCAAIDQPRSAVYRAHVLAGLREIYAAVAARRPVPTPMPAIHAVTTIRAWDRLAVVPRHGFCSVDDYYASESAGPRLRALALPTLIVAATGDPMVPAATVAPHLRELPSHVSARWVAGGHVGFRAGVDLGLGDAPGLEPQILAWLRRQ